MINLHIATRPRSGGHMLRTAINSCLSVSSHVLFEPFNRGRRDRSEAGAWWPGDTTSASWLLMKRKSFGEPDLFGWMLQYDQWRYLAENFGQHVLPSCLDLATHCVLLYRRDLLAQYVSRVEAERTQQWFHMAEPPPPLPDPVRTDSQTAPPAVSMYVCTTSLLYHADYYNRGVDDDFAVLRAHGVPTLLVQYEEMVSRFDEFRQVLGEFLGVDLSAIHPKTLKQQTLSMDQLVLNYDEAAKAVASANRHRFFGQSGFHRII